MSERHVTAVVLLSGSASTFSHRATLEALTAQTRSPDHVIVVAPSTLPVELTAQLDQATASGEIHEVIATSSTISQAGAVREALDLLARRRVDEDRSERRRDDASADGARRASGRRVADVDPDEIERRRTQEAEDLARIPLRLREERRIGRRAGSSGEDESWLWFLLDGSPPGHDALAQQLEVIGRSPNTAVVGAKRVRYSDNAAANWDPQTPRTADGADALVDVGLTLTHGGRIITGVDAGEIDQGQADWRQDVLAVALPGMLIRQQTLRDLDGLDPDLPAPWSEIDLCHRVWRQGERVAVQSSARVLFPDPTRPLLERLREQRTGRLLVLLKHRPLLVALLMLLVSPLTTLLRMAGAIAASTPRRALMELHAWIRALGAAPRVLRRGFRDRRRARVPGGRLAPLYLPRGEGARRRLEDLGTRLFAGDDRSRRIRRTTWGIAGTHHGIDDADYGRHIVWTVVVTLAAGVLSLLALRRLFGRGDLGGPALSALPRNWHDTWDAAWSTWVPGGLGERGPGDPLVRLLGHLPLNGPVLIETLVFAAIPLSALAAWWAAGAITRAVGARLVLAVTWSLAPSLLTALGAGAWPLLIVHVLLPLLALAVGRAIGFPHKVSQASVAAAAVGGLILLVIGAVQPVLVLLTAVALALLAPAVPGRRWRLLWVLLPSLALHLPYLAVYAAHPRSLLAVSGVTPQVPTASHHELLMLWPSAPDIGATITAALPGIGEAAQWLPALPLVPVVLAALIAPLLRGSAGTAGRFSLLVAAAGVVTVLLAGSSATAVAEGQLVPAPAHALLSLVLLALMIGAGASFDALARRERGDSRARSVVTGVIGSLVAVVCVVSVAGWSILLPGMLDLERVTGGQVPAAAADQGRTDARARVLVLDQAEDGSIGAGLVVHGGDSLIQRSAVTAARAVETVESGEPIDADPGSVALRDSVTAMLSTSGTDAAAGPSSLAVGYVIVPGDPAEQGTLVAALDASTRLEKVTASHSGGMWRVIDAAPNAYVTDGSDVLALASSPVGAHGEVPAAPEERTVVLSQRFDSQWRATLGETELEPTLVDDWAQGFVLPAGAAGEIDIHREQPLRVLWQAGLYAALALTVLVAIPWRPRSRTAEELYG